MCGCQFVLHAATTLLKYALDEAAKNPAIIEAYLHVQTSNADAKNFYLSHGFVEVETVLDYYRNIDPPHSFLLKRSLKEGHSIDGKSAESDTRPQDADQIDNTTAIVN